MNLYYRLKPYVLDSFKNVQKERTLLKTEAIKELKQETNLFNLSISTGIFLINTIGKDVEKDFIPKIHQLFND